MANTGKSEEELVQLLWPYLLIGELFQGSTLDISFHVVSEVIDDSIVVSEDVNAERIVDSHYGVEGYCRWESC
jgi:hypothetical protein